jgi:glycosyltransferase involved in cell wall biosynthesis
VDKMKLLIVLITHNRKAYTKRTISSLLATIEVPYYLVAVDNASTDGTQEYLNSLLSRNKLDHFYASTKNLYPGAAANRGWSDGLESYPQATHLMRLDNDMHFERGWDTYAEQYFETIDRLGQLGLDYDGGEGKASQYYNGMGLIEWPGCVGGPCIIRREIWNGGARYDETPWEGSGHPVQEDVKMSRAIKQDGWLVGHMDKRLSWTFATPDKWVEYPEYYRKTLSDRGWEDKLRKAGL